MITVMLAAAAAAQGIPPAPRVHGSREMLTTWRVAEMLCGGEPIRPVQPPEPYPAVDWRENGGDVRLAFRIDATGRPLGIEGGGGFGDASDLAPALAASRFAAGEERRDCTVEFSATRTPIAEAPVSDSMAYTIFPLGQPSRAVWDRVRQADTTCVAPPPALRNRAYPDFDAIPQPPGTTSWSMVGHDIDARGRPTNVRVVAGAGNAALDRASIDAVEASRFGPDARTGCLYPYWRRGPVLPAPPAPEAASMRPSGSTCPADVQWARKPALSFPEPFRRRGIEGWALIGFDLAPWGETGNIRVVAAEPAAAFGQQGVSIIRTAAAPPSGSGHTGCTVLVRFAMGTGAPGEVPEPPPPF